MVIFNRPNVTHSAGIENELNKDEIKELDILSREFSSDYPARHAVPTTTTNNPPSDPKSLHPVITAGLVGAFLAHAAIILSLPPVIRGRGAPFLPTAARGLDATFARIRSHPSRRSHRTTGGREERQQEEGRCRSSLRHGRFVDLGSGDGRVVFRAAREGMFSQCVGVEINPVLHAWAMARRLVQAERYWGVTEFRMQDLWSVDLTRADVVAVYGLHPIMGKLGKKMQKEMKDGSIVVSNVFTIPGWKTDGASTDGVHLYSIPECFTKKSIQDNK